MAENHRICILIPVYEHHKPLAGTLQRLLSSGLECLLVDDGSSPECAQALVALAVQSAGRVRLFRREVNGGKGRAIKDGLAWAQTLGYTHAFQVDADGQHELEKVPEFVALSQQLPDAAICARPVYDASVPLSRLRGRKITNFWIAINTLSRDIPDGMCGMRIYPVRASLKAALASASERMAFDTEILVRLSWMGVPLRFLPAQVVYPVDGMSTFRMGRDNVHISAMHTRLFFGMLWRLPLLLARRMA